MNEQKDESQKIQYQNFRPLSCWQKLLKKRHHYTQLPDRKIITNIPDDKLGTNEIQTSKYNFLTFFPVNLVEQFAKPSNLYFLLIGILQIIPQITISQGKPTMFLPLTFVVAISMIKDFIQDWKRHKNDQKQNNSEVQLVTQIGILKRKWKQIKVGQIIKIKKQHYFPCDILILQHSQQAKVAYVQTKNLDGQNNLKLKKAPDCLSLNYLQDQLQLANFRHLISYEKPNPFLNVFNGNIKVEHKKYMLDNNNVILRGCSLKINEYVIGMCLYNGHQAKILLNSANPKPKRSSIERYLNSYFKYIFIFQLTVTFISAMSYGIILGTNHGQYSYFNEGNQYFVDALFTWGSWFITFANFIPISLLVSLEFVRFGQGRFLERDQKCKSQDKKAEVQTSSVNEDLGQLQYILSDKTGTLTKNQMDFKFLYVNGVSYGQNQLLRFDVLKDHYSNNDNNQKQQEYSFQNSQGFGDEFQEPKIKEKLVDDGHSSKIMRQIQLVDKNMSKKNKIPYNINQRKSKNLTTQILSKLKSNNVTNVDFSQKQKKRLLQNMKKSTNDKEAIKLALVHLSLCHNVICQGDQYTSSSPDQVALASFARFIGYKFVSRNDKNEVEIQQVVPGQKAKILKYSLLHTLQFSSERKRMSVIVRQIQTSSDSTMHGRTLLLCKGADDIILKKLSSQSRYNQQQKLKQVYNELFNYACKGLRTLVLSFRILEQNYYNEWNQKYNQAWTIVSNTRYQKVCELQAQIEDKMHFVAATAIEDKLQDQVKQTISQLKKSNIKVWMLTGDKKQTAISIGYSTGLIDPTNQIITLDCEAEHAKQLIKNVQSMIPMIKQDKVTVLSGQFITQLDQQAKQLLGNILKQCVSVICCRVSPKGKQQITLMVKQWGKTLAIGDGANDVNMINSAHIGVGVRGIEGSQATRAADYVISEFKILKRLVLFYGINFYHRNCGVALFTLYKNILVTFPVLFYGPLSVESSLFIYEMWIFQFFNMFFASFPIIYFGLFDILYSQQQMIKRPYLYNQSQKSEYFNKWILIRQVLTSALTTIFLTITSYYITNSTIISNGLIIYQSWNGMFIFNVIVITVNLRIWNMSNQISFIQILLCTFGIVSYYLIFYLMQLLFYTNIKNTLSHQMTTWLYWILIVLYSFGIEGAYYIFNKIEYINLKIEQISKDKKFVRDIEMQQIRIQNVHLEDIAMQRRMTTGGYAFDEDQQRSVHFI